MSDKAIILSDRGTEINMLMTLDDYKSFIAIDDMSELADHLLQLGRTLGEADNFTEYYLSLIHISRQRTLHCH